MQNICFSLPQTGSLDLLLHSHSETKTHQESVNALSGGNNNTKVILSRHSLIFHTTFRLDVTHFNLEHCQQPVVNSSLHVFSKTNVFIQRIPVQTI